MTLLYEIVQKDIRLWGNIKEHINKNLYKLEKIKTIKNLPKILKSVKINQMKKGVFTKNEVYEWILKNK
mgnify:CR=1 FL=1